MFNKKGMSLEILATLIITSLIMLIIIVFIFSNFFINSLGSTLSVTMGSFTNNVRGSIIFTIQVFASLFLGMVKGIYYGSAVVGPTGPILHSIAEISGNDYDSFSETAKRNIARIESSLPFYEPKTGVINIGNLANDCGDSKINKENFKRQVAEMSADCWAMYGKGKYDPTNGENPPNPKNCYIIHFNLDEPVSLTEILKYMIEEEGSAELSYFEMAGGPPLIENSKNVKIIPPESDFIDFVVDLVEHRGEKYSTELFNYNKTIQQGVMFIKYGDDIDPFIVPQIWDSADCSIGVRYTHPLRNIALPSFLASFNNTLSASDLFMEDGLLNDAVERIIQIDSEYIRHSSVIEPLLPYPTGAITGDPLLFDLMDYQPPESDYVFWCFDETLTCSACGDKECMEPLSWTE